MEIRTAFHKALREIQDEVVVMGNMVEKALLRSVAALKDRDLTKAREVIEGDLKINDKRYAIEDKCILLIATQQPMAGDLRAIIGVLNIITEIERIGDHAEGIAKIAVLNGDEPPVKPLIDIPRMADLVVDMLHQSLDALITRDAGLAKEIADRDDQVDELYDQVFAELLELMTKNPAIITRATRLVWVTHNLERSADRVTNICERIVYMVTGTMEETNISNY